MDLSRPRHCRSFCSLDSRYPFLGIPGLAQLLCTLALAFLGPTTVVDLCSRHFYECKSFCRIYQYLILRAGLSSTNVNLPMYTRSGRGVHRETIEITCTSGDRVACWGLMYTTSIHKTHLPPTAHAILIWSSVLKKKKEKRGKEKEGKKEEREGKEEGRVILREPSR